MTETTENSNQPQAPTIQIDIIEVFRKIWDGRKTIYKTIAIFLIIGLIIIIGTPKEYISEVNLLVESNTGSSGVTGLLQQFGLAGINLAGNKDVLTPEVFPQVVQSTPFLLEIMNQKVTESKYDSTMTITQYLERHTKSSLGSVIMGYTFGLPGKIIGLIRGKPKKQELTIKKQSIEPFKLTSEQASIIGTLASRIEAKIGGVTNNGLVISVEMQDPKVATLLVDSVLQCLTGYIIDYRTQKAKTDLRFVEELHAKAEEKYLSTQRALAVYHDQNKNVIFATARAEEERLQAEYNLAFNVYNGLSQQLEQAKIKVQENTPMFKIVEPAQVPTSKSKPRTSLILFVMIFLGFVTGIAIIYGRLIYQNYVKVSKTIA